MMKICIHRYAIITIVITSYIIVAEDLSFKHAHYFIKPDYMARIRYHHHDDRLLTDTYQDEVYQAAHNLMKDHTLSDIADIGCGSGYKLMKYFASCNTTGYEIDPTLTYLKQKYPNRVWQESSLNSYPQNQIVDLIICADVIEHLLKPDELLNFINRFSFKFLVISTPDRDNLLEVQHSYQSQTGPPVNLAHVREWSFAEFRTYISQYFDVIEHFHTQKEWWGQVIIAVKK